MTHSPGISVSLWVAWHYEGHVHHRPAQPPVTNVPGPQQYPIIDKIADKIIHKYQTAGCQQSYEEKGSVTGQDEIRRGTAKNRLGAYCQFCQCTQRTLVPSVLARCRQAGSSSGRMNAFQPFSIRRKGWAELARYERPAERMENNRCPR